MGHNIRNTLRGKEMDKAGKVGCLIAIFAVLGIIPFVLLSSVVGIVICFVIAIVAGGFGLIAEQFGEIRSSKKRAKIHK